MITPEHIRELWGYRSLMAKLAWSDFKLRYKNSVLGFFWTLLEPLLMLLVLYVVFSHLMRVQVEHYQLFLLLGIVLWNFLARGTTMGIFGIIGKPSLVQKVYFPRDVLIISACFTALMMTLLELAVFAVFMIIFKVAPGLTILYSPLIFILLFLIVFGLATGLSALNVYFRDVQFIWNVVLQAGFFATPILYPVTIFPEHLQKIVMLNPIARIISMLRDCTLYNTAPQAGDLIYVVIWAGMAVLAGYLIFDRLEPRFAEEI